MVRINWIGIISPLCNVTGWNYIFVVVDYFLRFVWARGYGVVNQKAAHNTLLNFFVPVFGFLFYLSHDNDLHFIEALHFLNFIVLHKFVHLLAILFILTWLREMYSWSSVKSGNEYWIGDL